MVRYASQAPPAPLPEPRLPPLLVRALQRRRPDRRRDRARLEPRAHARRHGGPPLHGRRLRGLARLPAPGPDLLRPPGQDDQDHGRPRRHERGHRRVPASATAVVPRARSFSLAGTAPGRAEVHIKELGFHFIDPLAPIAEKEIVPRVRVFIPYLGIEGWISITSRGPASFSTQPELRSTPRAPRPTRPWTPQVGRRPPHRRAQVPPGHARQEPHAQEVLLHALPPRARGQAPGRGLPRDPQDGAQERRRGPLPRPRTRADANASSP